MSETSALFSPFLKRSQVVALPLCGFAASLWFEDLEQKIVELNDKFAYFTCM